MLVQPLARTGVFDLPKDFDGPALLAAMKGKTLAKGEALGRYTQNPAEGAKVSK